MKRQIISSIAAVAVIMTALTGCSEKKENSSQSTTTSSSTTSSESSSSATESSSAATESSSTVESTVSTSESAPESTSEPASTSESKTEVVKKTITLDDGFGEIEVPLDNNGEVNKYLQKIYDKGIIPEGTYAGTEILINEEGSEACIIFNGESVNHGNVPVYDFGFTTDWEPTPIEEDDKIWDDIIVPDCDKYVEKYEKDEISFVDFNKDGIGQAWECYIISILSSDAFELRGIIYL